MSSTRILRSYEFAHEAQLDLMKLHDEGITASLKNERLVSMAPHYSNAVGEDLDIERTSSRLD